MNKMVRNSVENRSREQFAAAEISTAKIACKNDWKSFWHCQFFAQRTNEVNLSPNFVEIESSIRNKGRIRRISFNWAYHMYLVEKSLTTIFSSCDQNTVKTCERSVCECDAQFMNALTQLLFENPALNPWSHNINYNYDKEKCEKKSINKRTGSDFQVSVDFIPRNQNFKLQFFCHFRLDILVLWIRCWTKNIFQRQETRML